MHENLDEKLRKALRPVEPEGDLANDVLARIDAHQKEADSGWRIGDSQKRHGAFLRRERRWKIPVALAASVAVAFVVGFELKQQQEGLRAREQLIEALQVTSSKLDLVHQIVQEHNQSDGAPENGA